MPSCRVLIAHLATEVSTAGPVLSIGHTGGFPEGFGRGGRAEESAMVVKHGKGARDTCDIIIDQPITARVLHYSGE